jgi:hypothetical protein
VERCSVCYIRLTHYGTVNSSVAVWSWGVSVISNGYVLGLTLYIVRRSSYEPVAAGWGRKLLSCDRSEPGLTGLVGRRKIPAVQRAKLPRYGREGAVEVRPFPAKKRLCVSEAQGLSGEAMKGNQTTMVIPGVDESKSTQQPNS